LQRLGAVRPWNGAAERWDYEPINSTQSIARAITRAYAIFRGLPELL
jgi:mitochondrial fission protein ELM1